MSDAPTADLQKCAVCGKEFDFNKEGLGCDSGYLVCGIACAKKATHIRGTKYAIHDKENTIVDTNATEEELL